MKRIILAIALVLAVGLSACGGTAGHIYPAISVADRLREKIPGAEFLFVGVEGNMETELVPREGYPIETLVVSGLRRSLTPANIIYNIRSLYRTECANIKAKKIIKKFKPDAVLGTGGYVCYPVIRAARAMGIPTLIHESNAYPGLTTKMLESAVDRIMVGFEDCRRHYKHPEKIAVTGTPVRGDLFLRTREEARAALGYRDNKPVVVSFWGSLGASTMNERMLEFFLQEKADGYPFHLIHAAGSSSWASLSEAVDKLSVHDASLDLRQYIHDMEVVMAAADLVIARAGASTISELTALGKAAILVPSPYVVANHQEKNASLLHEHGGALMMLESEATGAALYEATAAILSDGQRRAKMEQASRALGIPDATARLYETVMALL